MRAVVLAGGAGTRLRPLTLTTPKQVLPIVEIPMIQRVLSHLAGHGVTGVVLSLGYLHDAFVTLFPEGRFDGMALDYALEPAPLDTAGGVAFAARWAKLDERFLVVNGDVLTDLDITALMRFHEARGAEGTIALTKVEDPSAFGLVATASDGRVEAFVEKPPPEVAASALVNAGTYVLEPSVTNRIPEGARMSIEREVFPAMASEGRLYGFQSPDYWTDTGTPRQYLDAQLDLLTGKRPGPPSPGARELEPGIWAAGDTVRDGEIRGPSFLGIASYVAAGGRVERSVVGAGARVQEGALVQDSVLLPGAVVRPRATVTRSLVGEESVIGEGATVGDLSVIGGGMEVAPGSRLLGARLPEG